MATVLFIGDRAYSSWSLRADLVLRHADIPAERRLIRLDTPDTKGDVAAISAGRTVPALHVGSLKIWDSLAIAEWAHEQAPRANLWPRSANVRAIARSVSATMHAGFAVLRREAPMNLRRAGRARDLGEDAEREATALQRLWHRARSEAGVKEGPFLFGAWSIVDAMATPYATRLRSYAIPVESDVASYVHALLEDSHFLHWEAQALADGRMMDAVEKI